MYVCMYVCMYVFTMLQCVQKNRLVDWDSITFSWLAALHLLELVASTRHDKSNGTTITSRSLHFWQISSPGARKNMSNTKVGFGLMLVSACCLTNIIPGWSWRCLKYSSLMIPTFSFLLFMISRILSRRWGTWMKSWLVKCRKSGVQCDINLFGAVCRDDVAIHGIVEITRSNEPRHSH